MELIVLRAGREERVEVEHHDQTFEVRLGGATYWVDSVATNGAVRSLLIGGRQYEVAVRRRREGCYQVSYQGAFEEVEVLDPLSYLAQQGAARRARGGLERVTAYMPGRVVAVNVAEGDRVHAGQGLVVLEAMKMENEIQAERDGVVRQVFVTTDQAVEGGDPLFEIESADAGSPTSPGISGVSLR
ncbi:MAG: biotin/lipoyl-containing protein [Thermoanaerobaculia bacterium]